MLDGGTGCLSQSDTEGLAMCIVACAETLGEEAEEERSCVREAKRDFGHAPLQPQDI